MKVLNFLIGLLLLVLIVYTGYYTTNNTNFVIWFGVITAILAPIALEFIFYPFKSKDKLLIKDLSRVPEIDKLIKEANNVEMKVQSLEKQKLELEKLISLEAYRRTLITEKEIYIHQGVIALKKVKEINENIELLTKEKQELPEQIISLQNLIEKNGVEDFIFTFMGKTHIARKKYFESIPIYGSIFFELIKTISMINKETNNKK